MTTTSPAPASLRPPATVRSYRTQVAGVLAAAFALSAAYKGVAGSATARLPRRRARWQLRPP